MKIEPAKVYWFTGLSGAGKTTIANKVATGLRLRGQHVILLDGDELRSIFNATDFNNNHHTPEARLSLAKQYSRLCKIISDQGITVVIATISLFKEVFIWNRRHLSGYVEIYLKVSIDELRRRDPKGIYRQFDSGRLTHVSGLDLPFDEPVNADFTVEYYPGYSADKMADDILLYISEKKNETR